jgi:hypothetical protein
MSLGIYCHDKAKLHSFPKFPKVPQTASKYKSLYTGKDAFERPYALHGWCWGTGVTAWTGWLLASSLLWFLQCPHVLLVPADLGPARGWVSLTPHRARC